MSPLIKVRKITDIKTDYTTPPRSNLCVVKITSSCDATCRQVVARYRWSLRQVLLHKRNKHSHIVYTYRRIVQLETGINNIAEVPEENLTLSHTKASRV